MVGRIRSRAHIRKPSVSSRAMAVVASLVVSCTAAATDNSVVSPSRAPSPSAAKVAGLPPPVGPLAGLRWPAGALRPGMLLHDDGTRLWPMSLAGSRHLLWTHPAAYVEAIAVAPNGDSMAYAVITGSAGSGGGILYELLPDGSILTVDRTKPYDFISNPVFVRAPTDPEGPIRLYWMRLSEDFDQSVAQIPNQMMTLGASGPVPVEVPLRWGTSLYRLNAYPGAATSTLTLFRRENMPTRYEVLRDSDNAGGAASSPTVWGYWDSATDTDVDSGVAWMSPTEYVVGVGHGLSLPTYSLKLFRYHCEWAGSHLIYKGPRLDAVWDEAVWTMLPLGTKHVLVISRKASRDIAFNGATATTWLTVNIGTGKIRDTGIRYVPDRGVWVTVQPSMPTRLDADPKCWDTKWTWP